ncbi:hypothetical protein CONPUDRAFT_87708 [Coniophora puteana RWD-64-598 SS2]|uniref:Phytocyanin domain-containing protein n=1 Tax=Coniophora puteana (strain RWD-64-598) TaxID=741705 RepID=A0A5M3N2S9_CONPW|nr:uncharacterized protein CONPUDRAFT_87708 [Coniophora puteana RWD-64-598 SS2]EIW85221.1 hypothetical protein CONPUDRAFT_87708 [Coniophora puteana RWD-64-598 SS2]
MLFTLFVSLAAFTGAVRAAPVMPSMNSWTSPSVSSPSWSSSSAPAMMTGGSWDGSSGSSASSEGSWDASSSVNSWGSSTDTWTSAAPTYVASSTSSAAATYSTPSYGSGSWNWGNESPYDSCVQSCLASYGTPTATYMPPSSTMTGTASSGSTGTGTTHTIIVAPTQGVLRYVPFAVNASAGDMVEFVWNANEHTVTKSSQLTICNETTSEPFNSGEQNQTSTFTQMVNSTDSIFFYCATPGHCEKGMFGILNPPNADTSSNMTVASMMPSMVANNSVMSAMWSYTQMMTANNSLAAAWGSTMDLSNMPDWSWQYVMENVMYTRTFLAANPSVMSPDGTVNLSNASMPFAIPMDVTATMMSNGTMSSGSGTAAASSSTMFPTSNGARGFTASNSLVALATIAAIFFII